MTSWDKEYIDQGSSVDFKQWQIGKIAMKRLLNKLSSSTKTDSLSACNKVIETTHLLIAAFKTKRSYTNIRTLQA